MIGRAYMRAASSAVASVAIATLAILAVGPVIGASADPVEPCDPVTDPQCAVVTVTVTQTPPASSTGDASPSAEPVVTKTVTITPTPKQTKTKAPKPATTTTAPPASTTEQNPPPQTIPTLTDTPVTSPSPSPEDNGQVQLPTASAESSPDVAQQTPSAGVSFEQPDPQTVPIEIRNASPEYDKPTLAHRLAIPAAVLVGIALIAWLVFEGRLRRMAHAAAIRRGGPAAARTQAPEAAAYPAATPGYAPMVGFVPVQPYTMGYPQQSYGYPVPYGYAQPQPYGYPVADPAQMQAPQVPQAPQQGVADPWSQAGGEDQR
ncbi:hypothetical protein IL992_20000 [Microbispora sp. NEAU-D428]|uniref:hypothetical protein n=1 Tax=Microbispora sitophila TaxID=2771537 RepID=UPI0018669016|nr:hypothetical protein [Microbispora sitophila]MBE3011464.1 hypothetical protein [Microbispora sitophila]